MSKKPSSAQYQEPETTSISASNHPGASHLRAEEKIGGLYLTFSTSWHSCLDMQGDHNESFHVVVSRVISFTNCSRHWICSQGYLDLNMICPPTSTHFCQTCLLARKPVQRFPLTLASLKTSLSDMLEITHVGVPQMASPLFFLAWHMKAGVRGWSMIGSGYPHRSGEGQRCGIMEFGT